MKIDKTLYAPSIGPLTAGTKCWITGVEGYVVNDKNAWYNVYTMDMYGLMDQVDSTIAWDILGYWKKEYEAEQVYEIAPHNTMLTKAIKLENF